MTPTKERMMKMAVADISCDKKTQQKAIDVIKTTPFAKHRMLFMELLPAEGFGGDLKVDIWREIFAQIKKESDKNVKKYMLGKVLDLFFASGWGWFMRSGDSLSGFRRNRWEIPPERRAGAVTVLKMLKKPLYDTRQWTPWANFINKMIREYGGTVPQTSKKVEYASGVRKITKKRGLLHSLVHKTVNQK